MVPLSFLPSGRSPLVITSSPLNAAITLRDTSADATPQPEAATTRTAVVSQRELMETSRRERSEDVTDHTPRHAIPRRVSPELFLGLGDGLGGGRCRGRAFDV